MQHKQGENRNQMFMFTLESAVATNSFVRVVDAFVDTIDLKSFGFAHVECPEEGRPPYHPSVLIKLYLYGYHYGINTSRKLEREVKTDFEVMWLLSGLRPGYKTISDFRKNHARAFREVFRRFVCLLREWDLIEGKTVAIDSFKIRGNNSLKNNFNEKKLQRHLEYIEKQIREYEELPDKCEQEEERLLAGARLKERKEKQAKYEQVKKELEASGEEQISLTGPDSRAVVLLRNIVNVGYNIQASSDAKHKLFVEYDTGSVNDTHALAPMALQTKELLKVEGLRVLADKGYHTGEQLAQCEQHGITPYVSPKAPATKDIGLYPASDFIYAHTEDVYICPEGHQMRTNGRWHQHSDKRRNGVSAFRFKRYTTPGCRNCKSRHLCTKSRTNGRYIDRSEYAEVIEANAQRVTANPEYYRQRQQITEHPFGTLKRHPIAIGWGYIHTNLRGKEKVLGEVGILFIGYNLKRCVSIFGVQKLIKALKDCCLPYFLIIEGHVLSSNKRFLFSGYKIAV